ncbi:MAG: 2Fe-2S iron-sulfur cluster binding domain-containing protein [Gammaproteobacteria bacterium]|nr:2Fe-2S iron-sulfur cluster binding domain-containing protein [Gammaproteobacteria bacterium]
MKVKFILNNKVQQYNGDEEMPLLWYLRDYAKLRGTKYGCGIGACGACTVHIDKRAVRSCTLKMKQLEGRAVRTIEDLATNNILHIVQRAWIDEDVAQCGYCQAGQIMSVVAMLESNPRPGQREFSGLTNICRCGTYPRMRKAIERAVRQINLTSGL